MEGEEIERERKEGEQKEALQKKQLRERSVVMMMMMIMRRRRKRRTRRRKRRRSKRRRNSEHDNPGYGNGSAGLAGDETWRSQLHKGKAYISQKSRSYRPAISRRNDQRYIPIQSNHSCI